MVMVMSGMLVAAGMAETCGARLAAACAGERSYGVCAHVSRPGEFETRIGEMRLMKEIGIEFSFSKDSVTLYGVLLFR